jgi:hypothetical protein
MGCGTGKIALVSKMIEIYQNILKELNRLKEEKKILYESLSGHSSNQKMISKDFIEIKAQLSSIIDKTQGLLAQIQSLSAFTLEVNGIKEQIADRILETTKNLLLQLGVYNKVLSEKTELVVESSGLAYLVQKARIRNKETQKGLNKDQAFLNDKESYNYEYNLLLSKKKELEQEITDFNKDNLPFVLLDDIKLEDKVNTLTETQAITELQKFIKKNVVLEKAIKGKRDMELNKCLNSSDQHNLVIKEYIEIKKSKKANIERLREEYQRLKDDNTKAYDQTSDIDDRVNMLNKIIQKCSGQTLASRNIQLRKILKKGGLLSNIESTILKAREISEKLDF